MTEVQSLLAANERLSEEVLRASADQIDQSRRFPRENIAALGKAGVRGGGGTTRDVTRAYRASAILRLYRDGHADALLRYGCDLREGRRRAEAKAVAILRARGAPQYPRVQRGGFRRTLLRACE